MNFSSPTLKPEQKNAYQGEIYRSEKGMEFIKPEKWKGKVEISEDVDSIIFNYVMIPNKKIFVFKIKTWSHEDYEKNKQDIPKQYIIGKNKQYVFDLITAIDVEMDFEESQKYIDDFTSMIIPVQEIIERTAIR